ncbi:MAG: alcohol dehydrogenase catalytic domain-containing protein [Myxococcales bacterium]|nr:alcohol dehydrogenase catalytic domain-containing protein [Myxococcales bacterium]
MTKTMRAFRMVEWQKPPELVEIPVPEPGPGQVRVKVAGNGLCQSDLHMPHLPDALGQFMGWQMPFTLGHEVGGWVDAWGSGVTGWKEGQPVALISTRSCGACLECDAGFDNACTLNQRGRGYGMDGGIADYVLLENVRPLIPITKLDPKLAGPLTDAGTTSYHGVARVKEKLGPGRTALVIGAGGLGGFAIQYLKLLTQARILVVDTAADKRARAIELGADEVIDGLRDDLATEILRLTEGRGADAVLDFVGNDATVATSIACLAKLSTYAVIGAGEGKLAQPLMGALAGKNASIISFVGGTAADTRAALDLADQGLLRNDVELFDLADAQKAFDKLAAGELVGRGIIVP